MKLNNGKGWEAMKQHPSQAHLHAHHNNVANTSARDVHANRASKTPIPPGRLEQELPKPGAVRSPAQAQRVQQPQQQPEQKPSGMQKFFKVLCCG